MSLLRTLVRFPRTFQAVRAVEMVYKPGRSVTTTSARFEKIEHVSETEVPAMTFTADSKATKTVLKIDQSKPFVVSSAVADVAKKAFALEKGLAEKLPPTLQKYVLTGKVAVITGGARGLGWNMAQALAESGVKAIAILDVQQEVGEKAAVELNESTGIPVTFYKVDIRDNLAIAEVVSKITEAFGSLDILVNSAGIADSNIKAEDYDSDKFRNLIDINVTGAFFIAQACARAMIAQGTGGSIILVASMSGSVVNFPQEQSCYNASKAAVVMLGKCLAAEWARHGIRVNMISPGYMDTALNRVPALEAQKEIWTGRTPMKRLGAVDELNGLAVYLASDASSLMTGSNCIIDGGYSVY